MGTYSGKITIVDVTDVGYFSVYPYANGPATQIYSEESNIYYPDWEAQNAQNEYTSPLVITPVVTYAGQDVTTNATVNWYLKEDLQHPITTGGSYVINNSTKQLTVTENISLVDKFIVYVVKASYNTNTGAYVEAQGEISFSLLTQPSSVKSVDIIGSNAIKYASDSTIPSPSQITLTANLTGGNAITGDGWKYWDGNDWSTNYISNSGAGAVNGITLSQGGYNLTLNASYNNDAAYFNSDIAKFKYVAHATADATDIYQDIFTVYQLRDGASGQSLVTMDLTNDSQLVPLDSSGTAQWSAIGDLSSTTVYVYRGKDDITAENPIKATLINISGVELWNGSTQYSDSWTSGSNLPTNYYKIKVTGFTSGTTSGSIEFETTVYSYESTTDTIVQSGTTYYSQNTVTGIYSAVSNPSGNPTSQGWYVRTGSKIYNATFSLVGAPAGSDGQTPTIYALDFPSIPALVNNPTGSAASGTLTDNWSYSPANLSIKAYKITTDSNGISTRNAYVESINNTLTGARVWYTPNIVNGNPATGNSLWGSLDLDTNGEGTLSASSKLLAEYSPYTFRLVGPSQSNIAENIKDEESINIVSDGYTGNDGNDAINLLIDNENVTLNATETGKTRAMNIVVGYQGFIGSTESSNFQLNTSNKGSCSKNGLVTINNITTNTAQKTVTIPINANVDVIKGETGTITLNFLYTGITPNITISKVISWDAKWDAKDGANSIELIFDYGEDILLCFDNGNGQTTLTPKLMQNGNNILSSSDTVTWRDVINNTVLSGSDIAADGITAIIDASDVEGVGTFSCTVVKNGVTYVRYETFKDYSDPLRVDLLSTVGEELTNGIGAGVVYPQTILNNQSLDEVSMNTVVAVAASSSPSTANIGDYYYNLSSGSNQYKIFKYTESGWQVQNNPTFDQIFVINNTSGANPIVLKNLNTNTGKYTINAELSNLSYVWSFRDINGNIINPSTLTDLKVSDIDASNHADYSDSSQVTGGQFIYINKNVINKKVIIFCKVIRNE